MSVAQLLLKILTIVPLAFVPPTFSSVPNYVLLGTCFPSRPEGR